MKNYLRYFISMGLILVSSLQANADQTSFVQYNTLKNCLLDLPEMSISCAEISTDEALTDLAVNIRAYVNSDKFENTGSQRFNLARKCEKALEAISFGVRAKFESEFFIPLIEEIELSLDEINQILN